MNRITEEQLNGVLVRYVRALDSLGMLQGGLRLIAGSKTNGRAYRLFFLDSGMAAPGTLNGFLGWTKREAYDTLYAMVLTLEAVNFHQSEV